MKVMKDNKNHSFPPTLIEYGLFFAYRFFVFKRKLKDLGDQSYISPFAYLQNMDCISIGKCCTICRSSLIQAVKIYEGRTFIPEIRIDDNAYVGAGVTISCTNNISIGKGVTIGDNVYIADGRHGYEDVNEDIHRRQHLISLGRVDIGKGSWIGYGAFIAGDIHIGQHSVIGANSVVTDSVPPYSVVTGVPAKIIKQYDFKISRWVKIPLHK
jgi:acetyltransferase-like isoleucine patch superfamily enzyme